MHALLAFALCSPSHWPNNVFHERLTAMEDGMGMLHPLRAELVLKVLDREASGCKLRVERVNEPEEAWRTRIAAHPSTPPRVGDVFTERCKGRRGDYYLVAGIEWYEGFWCAAVIDNDLGVRVRTLREPKARSLLE